MRYDIFISPCRDIGTILNNSVGSFFKWVFCDQTDTYIYAAVKPPGKVRFWLLLCPPPLEYSRINSTIIIETKHFIVDI